MNIPPFALLHRAALLLRRTAGDLFVPPLTMSLPATSGLSNKCHQTRCGVIAPKEAVAVCLDSSYLQNRACLSSVSAAPCGAFPAPAAAACTPSCDSPGAVVQPPAAPLAPAPQGKGTCVCSRGTGDDRSLLHTPCRSGAPVLPGDPITTARIGELCRCKAGIRSVQGKELPGKTNLKQLLSASKHQTCYFIPYK